MNRRELEDRGEKTETANDLDSPTVRLTLADSADLYARLYEQDADLQQLTALAIHDWPLESDMIERSKS